MKDKTLYVDNLFRTSKVLEKIPFCQFGLNMTSDYYSGLFRIMRSREVLYNTPTTHKLYLKTQHQFLSSFFYFIPVTAVVDNFLVKDLVSYPRNILENLLFFYNEFFTFLGWRKYLHGVVHGCFFCIR